MFNFEITIVHTLEMVLNFKHSTCFMAYLPRWFKGSKIYFMKFLKNHEKTILNITIKKIDIFRQKICGTLHEFACHLCAQGPC